MIKIAFEWLCFPMVGVLLAAALVWAFKSKDM